MVENIRVKLGRWLAIGLAAGLLGAGLPLTTPTASFAALPTGVIESLGFPTNTGSGVAAGSFRAAEVAEGIYVADRSIPRAAQGVSLLPYSQWGAPLSDGEWSNYVTQIKSMIDSIATTPLGRTTLAAAGELTPTKVDQNRWVRWDRGAASGDSDVGTVIFPNDQGVDVNIALNPDHGKDGVGTVSAIEFDPNSYEQSFENAGQAVVQDVRSTLQHEIYHAAQAAAGGNPSTTKTRVITDLHLFNSTGSVTSSPYSTAISRRELWTQGGPRDLVGARAAWADELQTRALLSDLPSGISDADATALAQDLATDSNGYLNWMRTSSLIRGITDYDLRSFDFQTISRLAELTGKYASATQVRTVLKQINQFPADLNPYLMRAYTSLLPVATDPASLLRAQIRLGLAANPPTTVKFAEQLNTVARSNYISGLRDSGAHKETFVAVTLVGTALPTKAELLNPYGSGRFVAATNPGSASCVATRASDKATSDECDQGPGLAVTPEEVKQWADLVTQRPKEPAIALPVSGAVVDQGSAYFVGVADPDHQFVATVTCVQPGQPTQTARLQTTVSFNGSWTLTPQSIQLLSGASCEFVVTDAATGVRKSVSFTTTDTAPPTPPVTPPASALVIPDGRYQIQATYRTDRQVRVWDVYDWATADGSKVAMWPSTGGANEQFDISTGPDGYSVIRSASSGKCVVPSGSAVNSRLQLGACDLPIAKVKIEHAGSQYFLKSNSFCIADLGTDNSAGPSLDACYYTGSSWFLNKVN